MATNPPSLFTPTTTPTQAQTLAAQKAALGQQVLNACRDKMTDLLNFRNSMRATAWRRASGFSPPEFWQGIGTSGGSLVATADKLDEVLEFVNPGCLNGDVGVPSDYAIAIGPDGTVTCVEAVTVGS